MGWSRGCAETGKENREYLWYKHVHGRPALQYIVTELTATRSYMYLEEQLHVGHFGQCETY